MNRALNSSSSRVRKAWVSGASSGLGRAFAEALLAEGISVWGTSRSPARLDAWSDHPLFHPVELDLHDREKAVAAYRNAAASADGFDLVIHNAGYGVFGPFEELPWAAWERQLEAMVLTTVALNHASFADLQRAGRGTLVNVASLAVQYPLPYMAGYNVAKAALAALSESLIFEARGTAVQVIDFRPGDFRTAFNDAVHREQASARTARAWRALEQNLASAPGPEQAVSDLWRAVRSGRSGTVTSGGFFQARLARVFAKLAPSGLRRAVSARFFEGGRRG